MSISDEVRIRVRQRAGFACEYCGVTETHSAGELTIDHFRPTRFGGGDESENLIYCCVRCNLYKSDYWPVSDSDPTLWNPRENSRDAHFFVRTNGHVSALSATGEFSIRLLQLNRPQLIAYRKWTLAAVSDELKLAQLADILDAIRPILDQNNAQQQQQKDLLKERLAKALALFNQSG